MKKLRRSHSRLGLSLFAAMALGACGVSGSTTSSAMGGGQASSASGSTTNATGSGGAQSTGSGPSTSSHAASTGSGSTTASATTSGGSVSSATSSSSTSGGAVVDPNVDGPYTYTELDSTVNVASSGDNNVAIHCAYPTAGPTSGPYPVIVVGHGLSLPASQYYGYVRRLASFGYVALTVDFPASPFSVNNDAEADDLLAGIDWAKNDPTVGPKADSTRAGMTGHSLGGKVALLAATKDPRVKAAIVLDPVDGGGPGGCNAPACVVVAGLLPNLHIPTGFLGETTDSAGGFMPCAPAASNFTTFYAKANTPSLEVTVIGADHMSFLDDVSTCGFTCSFCQPASAPNAQVNGLARAYVAAFYERWLRGIVGYDDYLTGAQASARYVATGEATIVSK